MKIILFYDNLIRDYRGLLLLFHILKGMGQKVYLKPLWDDSIHTIKWINPDTVVMGQVSEYATSRIGLFCYKNGINLVLNTTETVAYDYRIEEVMFKVNFEQYNSQIIDMQVIVNKYLNDFITQHLDITCKYKYRFLGFPRFDISIDRDLHEVEIEKIKQKYGLKKYKKVFLYISSFVYDKKGGQLDKKNKDNINVALRMKKELELKKSHKIIIKRLLKDIIGNENVLLIKKHPWDKSDYFERIFKEKNCIILDNYEYIASVIGCSNFIIHKQSTSAIEAWIQNKKTVSLLPDFDGDRSKLMYHMKYEVIATNYAELRDIVSNYPIPYPTKKMLEIYKPYLDGKSTIRLAKQICKLRPKSNKKIFEKDLHRRIFHITKRMFEYIKRKTMKSFGAKIDMDSYIDYFYFLEFQKKTIYNMYKEPIKKYIMKNKEFINK